MTTARIQRWAIILSAYNDTLCYRSGSENRSADCMSRLNFNNDHQNSFSTIENHAPVTAKEVACYTNRDPVLSKVYNYINHGWSSIVEEQLKPYF